MAKYYNTDRQPQRVTLSNGKTFAFSPRAESSVPDELVSFEIISLVKSGKLRLRKDQIQPSVKSDTSNILHVPRDIVITKSQDEVVGLVAEVVEVKEILKEEPTASTVDAVRVEKVSSVDMVPLVKIETEAVLDAEVAPTSDDSDGPLSQTEDETGGGSFIKSSRKRR
jgi:hypothetical protein